MIVLDASALIELLLHTAAGEIVAIKIKDPTIELHIPHLADVEVTQALRRYVRSGEISAEAASAALDSYRALDLQRHPHENLLDRIWELRENVTAYDAAYIALAENLGSLLLTCDGKLSRAPGLRNVGIELIQTEI